MSNLAPYLEIVQEAAEAISFALNVEVEIIDHELNIIGGTGASRLKAGQKEKRAQLSGDRCRLGDYCSPIVTGGRVWGWIAVFASPSGLQPPLQQVEEFVNRMSHLLAAAITEREASLRREELAVILETIHEGALVINSSGVVTYCNATAEKLLKANRSEIIGIPLHELWPQTPALQAMAKGQEYTEKEEIYHSGERWMHFIVTLRLITGSGRPGGAVISFRDIAEARRLIYDLSETSLEYTFDDIIGNSYAIQRVKEMALRVADTNSTVLITGESGTGKEVFARAIHNASHRADGPFISVNCGAIPENLLESELFGYEGGAFTGALKEGKTGKFELADKGTIFLDEIGEMPLHLQVKLLHVLQNREVERVGGSKKIPVDVRIIAASNRDLDKMMQERKFRKDLYFRLGVIPLHIPPLKERKEDIPLLAEHYLKVLAVKLKRPHMSISAEVMERFLSYDWPGNVRELENVLEYAVNMCAGRILSISCLPPRLCMHTEEPSENSSCLKTMLLNYERSVIKDHLKRFGTSSKAKNNIARALGISRATLYRKISELGIKD